MFKFSLIILLLLIFKNSFALSLNAIILLEKLSVIFHQLGGDIFKALVIFVFHLLLLGSWD